MTVPASSYGSVTCRSSAWRPAWRAPATSGRQRTCWCSRLHSDPARINTTTTTREHYIHNLWQLSLLIKILREIAPLKQNLVKNSPERDWGYLLTFTLTLDDLESHIVVNVSSTLTNSTIWFVVPLSFIVDVRRTYVQTDGHFYRVY